MRDLTETTVGVQRVFSGRALTIDVVDVALPDGRLSRREIVRHRGASVVLAERPDGRFVFVRQYRRAIEETLLEIVAGCLEPDEAPEVCARRELEEESGYIASELTSLGAIVPCPGYTEERLHLFHACVGMEPGAQAPDSDENLEPVLLTEAEVEAAIDSGELHDGKSLTAWFLWRRLKAKRGGMAAH